MILQEAVRTANAIKARLEPYCDRIEIAGSIRRMKSWVNDIDIVCIPNNQGQFIGALQELGKIKMGGKKIIRLECTKSGEISDWRTVSVDIYIATPETWATLLLIRTGSKEHNIKLCKLARRNGMVLHADGSGLFKIAPNQTPYDALEDERIAGESEESIFCALGLTYVPPEKRI